MIHTNVFCLKTLSCVHHKTPEFNFQKHCNGQEHEAGYKNSINESLNLDFSKSTEI